MREITQNDIRFILPFKGFIFGDKIKIKGKYNRYITLAHGMGKNTEYYDLKSQGFGQDFWYMGYWYYAHNFGMKGHNGIDYRTPVNCKVFSQTDGIVVKTHDINDDYGKYIIIRTPEFMIDGVRCKYETIYAHLNKVDVKLNDTVKQGDYIGLTGNCFDKETEILTDKGWKYFKDLDETEKVATLNIEKNELEFQKPESYTKTFEQYMNLCDFGKANFCVSDNHNMLVYYGRKNDKLKLIEYDKLPNKHRIKFKHTTNWVGKEELHYIIPSIIKNQGFLPDKYCPEIKIDMDLWLTFLGILIADGNIDIKRNRIQITQSTSYKNNVKFIYDILNSLPFHYNTFERKRFEKYNSDITWSISNKQLCECLKEIGKGNSKKAPEFIKGLSSRQIKIFLDSFFVGDGYERRNKERYYYPGLSKILADQLQEYILKIGGCANISEKIFNIEKNYQVYEHNSDNSWIVKDNCKRILYNDFAYCVSVPNKTLYVRRNGRPIFLGNTGKYTTGPHIHNASRLYWYENGAWKYDKNNGYSGYVDIEHLIKYKYIYPTNR